MNPVLNIADHSDGARSARRTSDRGALLAAIASPTNWHKQHDCRPQLRTAIDALDEPALMRTWGRWLVDRLDARGDLHRADVAVLVRISPVSRRSTYRYLAVLEAAGLIERTGTAVLRRGRWRRTATISAAARFRAPVALSQVSTVADSDSDSADALTCDSARSDTFPTLVVVSSGAVGDHTTGSRRDDEQISDEQRHALDEQWPLMARARSDVPLLRPGYGTNTRDPAERARLMLDRQGGNYR